MSKKTLNIVATIMAAMVIVVGIFCYQSGKKDGKAEYEKQMVYAIAYKQNKRVGNFTLFKIVTGETCLVLNDTPDWDKNGKRKTDK